MPHSAPWTTADMFTGSQLRRPRNTSVHFNSVCLISDKGTLSLYLRDHCSMIRVQRNTHIYTYAQVLDEKITQQVSALNTSTWNSDRSIHQTVHKLTYIHTLTECAQKQPEFIFRYGKCKRWPKKKRQLWWKVHEYCLYKLHHWLILKGICNQLAWAGVGDCLGWGCLDTLLCCQLRWRVPAQCGTSYVLCFSSVGDDERR